MKWIFATLLLVPSLCFGGNIALIGDSLMAGAAPYVKQAMPCVTKIKGNWRDSGFFLSLIDDRLAGQHFSIIYFDVGMWDIARRIPTPGHPWTLDPSDSAPVTNSIPEYQANLAQIAAKLKKYGDTVIFMNITDVPEGSIGRLSSDVEPYNLAAHDAIIGAGIKYDSMRAFMLPYAYLHADNHGNLVHYVSAGQQIMAGHIVDVLQANGGC